MKKRVQNILFIVVMVLAGYWVLQSIIDMENTITIYRARINELEGNIEILQGNQKEIQKKLDIKYIADKIIQCESGGVHNVWGDLDKPYPSFGILQYQKRTFNWLAQKANFKGNWRNEKDQIRLLYWSLNNDFGRLWTCYNKIR